LAKRYPIAKKVVSELFGFSERTYQSWRTDHNENKKEHPIIDLIEKYFSEEEVREFLKDRKIEKYEYVEYLYTLEKEKFLKMAEAILYNSSVTAKFVLKLIQKYEQRYYHLKKKHIEAEKKEQCHIYYVEAIEEEYIEILEYPTGYLTLDKYLTSIIFNPNKLSEILGKNLFAKSLFDLQSAIQEISKENLVPVIKKNMDYLLEKSETYKSESELWDEYEEEQNERATQYRDDIESLTTILKEKGVNVDQEYVDILHMNIEELKNIYTEKSYEELVNMAWEAKPRPNHLEALEKSYEEGSKDYLKSKKKNNN